MYLVLWELSSWPDPFATCQYSTCGNSKTKYRVASGDLPQARAFGDKLSMVDIRKYDKLDKSKVVKLDQVRCRGRGRHELS